MKAPIRVEIEPEYGPDGKLTAECVDKAKSEIRAALDGAQMSPEDRKATERALEDILTSGDTPKQIIQKSRDNILGLLGSCLMRLSDLPSAVMGLAMATDARPGVYELGKISAMIQVAEAMLSGAREELQEMVTREASRNEAKPRGQA